jgi:hypothetical protein
MWHGILVDAGFIDEEITDYIKIIGYTKGGHWTLMKVEVADDELDEFIRVVQKCMKDNFYTHIYNRPGHMIVIYKDKVFRMSIDKSTWSGAIKHGIAKGIPPEQLDFYPYRFEDETY